MKIGGGVENSPNTEENRLVLSIDQNGRIIFFNKECEKIAGYSKNEVLDKHILDLLIPEKHRDQWEKIFDSVLQNKISNNFKLPLITKQGEEILANWTVGPVNDSDARIGDLGLVGEILPFNNDEKPRFNEFKEEQREIKNKEFVLFNFNNKKLVFRKKPSSYKKKYFNDLLNEESSRTDKEYFEKNKIDESGEKDDVVFDEAKTTSNKKKTIDGTRIEFQKYSHDALEKNYETFKKSIHFLEELQEKNKELEKENKKLKSDIQKFNKKDKIKIKEIFRSSIYFVFDTISGKKKKEEFDIMINRLEQQKMVLKDIETQLNKDKININKSRDDFVKWREKLELLEEEIRKQEKDLTSKEERVRKNLLFFMDENKHDKGKTFKEENQPGEVEKDHEIDHHPILDKIPNSAAIIQRGILKQVNDLFIELLGYNSETLLEKNLLDFVTPEGFPGIESYYLKRLKGDNATSYETIFQTKFDDKITVEVSTKPVMFNGEKAEMAVFKKMVNKQDKNIPISSNNRLKNHEEVKEIDLEVKNQNEADIKLDERHTKPEHQSVDEETIDKNRKITENNIEKTTVENKQKSEKGSHSDKID